MLNRFRTHMWNKEVRSQLVAPKRLSRGFTMAELLIAVAIIGVLVGIALPMFGAQQAYSRRRTDEANYNAAKEAATVQWLRSGMPDGASYCYKIEPGQLHGTVVTGDDIPAGYGLSTVEDWANESFEMKRDGDGNPTYPADSNGNQRFVRVSFDSEGITEAVWSNEGGSAGTGGSTSGNTGNSGTSGSIDNEVITEYTDKDDIPTGGSDAGSGGTQGGGTQGGGQGTDDSTGQYHTNTFTDSHGNTYTVTATNWTYLQETGNNYITAHTLIYHNGIYYVADTNNYYGNYNLYLSDLDITTLEHVHPLASTTVINSDYDSYSDAWNNRYWSIDIPAYSLRYMNGKLHVTYTAGSKGDNIMNLWWPELIATTTMTPVD